MLTTLPPVSAPAMALAALLVAATFGIVFLAAHRRHPEVPGPGWWSVAGLLATVSFAGLIYRFSHQGASYVGMANTTLLVAMLLGWLGMRAHLGLGARLDWVWRFALPVALVNAVLFALPEARALRPVFFLLVVTGLTLATLRDLARENIRERGDGLRLLFALSLAELLAVAGVGLEVALASSAGRFTMQDSEAGIIMAGFFLSALIRLVVYLVLFFDRLQSRAWEAQQALRQREALSWDMLEGLRAGVLALDRDGTVMRANTLAAKWLRLVPAAEYNGARLQLSTEGWVDEKGAPLGPGMAPHLRSLAEPASPAKDTVLGLPSVEPGGRRWVLCNAYVAGSGSPAAVPVVLTLVDVTAVRQAQDQERERQVRQLHAQKMEALGSLASGVAHDFNNVLAAIRGYVHLLQERPPEAGELAHALMQVDKAARKGRDMVRRILAFGRQQGVNRQLVDVQDLVADVAALLQVLRPPPVTLDIRLPDGLSPVLGDVTQLSQVVLNLGTNAIQAIGTGAGQVAITAQECAADAVPAEGLTDRSSGAHSAPLALRWVRIEVTDTGCGMDEATQARMFEPYFTTKPAGHGTGLGLATVQSIVRAHGGFIGLHSRPGEGSRFSVWLPAAETATSSFPASRL